jgi:hypothetical protein
MCCDKPPLGAGCELNLARLEWEGAAFMLGPDERNIIPHSKDASLWFNVDTNGLHY